MLFLKIIIYMICTYMENIDKLEHCHLFNEDYKCLDMEDGKTLI